MAGALRGPGFRAAVVQLVLVSLLAVNASAAFHDRSDDPTCDGILGGGGYGLAIVPADGPVHKAEHCVVCHALQSARASQDIARHAPPVAHVRVAPPMAVSVRDRLVTLASQVRAPPAA
ncbi:MAG: hypothetical protein AB7O28_01035 [Vicinamibacterales bacterium]